MAITKQKKSEIIAKVRDAATDAASLVFVHFKGLSMEDTSAMRKELRQNGVGYMVAKKTLIRTALTDMGQQGTLPELPGEIALAWSKEDPTLAARSVYEQGKKYKDSIAIVGGVFEGAYQDSAQMNAVATIPPLPVLRGMFVNVINSPIQRLAIAMGQIAEKRA